MQIGGVNSFLTQIGSIFTKKTTSEIKTPQPDPQIWVNTAIEKLSIEKKAKPKRSR